MMCYNEQMEIASLNTYSYVDSTAHAAGCQCASCCVDSSSLDQHSQTLIKEEQADKKNGRGDKLNASERQLLGKLQQRDSEVRAHEAAHISAGGSAVGGAASFSYQKGPDGRLYAIGGEVPISISSGSNPEETIRIAQQIQSAALAPANPSPQDYKVAATAVLMEAKARQELSADKAQQIKEKALDIYQSNQSSLDPL